MTKLSINALQPFLSPGGSAHVFQNRTKMSLRRVLNLTGR